MKTNLLSLALLAAFALPVSAQTSGESSASQPAASDASAASGGTARPSQQQYGEGGSKHCDQLSGTEKQTCLQDEGAKTDRKQEPSAAAPAGSTASQGDASGGNSGMNATQSND